jgi:hypothetical protein
LRACIRAPEQQADKSKESLFHFAPPGDFSLLSPYNKPPPKANENENGISG